MTVDPINRYLYLRRHTLGYPTSEAQFWDELQKYQVAYLLIARPIRFGPLGNVKQEPDPNVESTIKPLIAAHPECFSLTFHNDAKNTKVYQVDKSCPLLGTGQPTAE